MAAPATQPIADRVAARVVITTAGCHEWTGAIGADGYGRIKLRVDGRPATLATHRVAYELANGPIPDGLHIDHLCRNRPCCNPAHLEAVTQAVNNERMRTAHSIGGAAGTCIHGHEFTDANTYVTPDGRRQCRACNKERARVHRHNRAALNSVAWPQLVSE